MAYITTIEELGRQLGFQEGKQFIIKSMLDSGQTIESVSKLTGISKSEVAMLSPKKEEPMTKEIL